MALGGEIGATLPIVAPTKDKSGPVMRQHHRGIVEETETKTLVELHPPCIITVVLVIACAGKNA